MLRRLSLILAWPFNLFETRRALAQLADMDDRGLADIGLTRQDLRDVTALRFGEDPTAALAEKSAERRRLAKAARRRLDRDCAIAAE